MEVLVQSSSDGRVYDISSAIGDITVKDEINVASKMTFSYQKQGIQFPNGSLVRFKIKGKGFFYGYIFESKNDKSKISSTAYDQLRYLKYKDTLIMKEMTASKLINLIANKQQLTIGKLEDSVVILPSAIFQNKTYLDMISTTTQDTLIASKKKFILRDNFGSIDYMEANNLRQQIVIGDKHLAENYAYTKSIDNNTFNQIKLCQKNGNTLDTIIIRDNNNIAKWGTLQHYEEVDKNVPLGVIKQKAEDLLRLYNQEEKKLTLDGIGAVECRAGHSIRVKLDNIGIDEWFIIKSASHKFSKNNHTMDLEVIS